MRNNKHSSKLGLTTPTITKFTNQLRNVIRLF